MLMHEEINKYLYVQESRRRIASSHEIRNSLSYTAVAIITFVILQAVTIVIPVFVHSTSAWLLGFMPSPPSVVWGNSLTMRGWDEGVPHSTPVT